MTCLADTGVLTPHGHLNVAYRVCLRVCEGSRGVVKRLYVQLLLCLSMENFRGYLLGPLIYTVYLYIPFMGKYLYTDSLRFGLKHSLFFILFHQYFY